MQVNVIVADDHPLIIDGVRLALARDSRIRVVGAATSVSEVFHLLASTPCDVLLTDFQFGADGQADGLTYLKRVRRLFPALKVVVLSMFAGEALARTVRTVAINGSVPKTAPMAVLVPAVIGAYEGRECHLNPSGSPVERMASVQRPKDKLLSPREEEVLRLYLSGLSLAEIAHHLNRSIKTISSQRIAARRKLGATSDAELVRLGLALFPELGALPHDKA